MLFRLDLYRVSGRCCYRARLGDEGIKTVYRAVSEVKFQSWNLKTIITMVIAKLMGKDLPVGELAGKIAGCQVAGGTVGVPLNGPESVPTCDTGNFDQQLYMHKYLHHETL